MKSHKLDLLKIDFIHKYKLLKNDVKHKRNAYELAKEVLEESKKLYEETLVKILGDEPWNYLDFLLDIHEKAGFLILGSGIKDNKKELRKEYLLDCYRKNGLSSHNIFLDFNNKAKTFYTVLYFMLKEEYRMEITNLEKHIFLTLKGDVKSSMKTFVEWMKAQ